MADAVIEARMNTPEFRDDADAEQHLIRHLRRMLVHCFYQDTVPLEERTEQRVADEFADNEHFRRNLDLQGINPDTLFAYHADRAGDGRSPGNLCAV
jgi:hypothetical protein